MSHDDHALASRAATDAGALLVRLRARLDRPDPERGEERGAYDVSEVRDAGDRESHRFLMDLLAVERPDDAVLSEEGARDPARLDARRVWIVDPLDGTREFGEAGRTDWAVHVALVEAGTVVAAAVALPALGETLTTDPAPSPPPVRDRPPRVVVSRTRPPAVARDVAAALGGELVEMGSAGAKVCAVVRGEVDVYVHDGGQYEWDSAAPVGVAAAAGCHVSRIDGAPLRYNRPDPWLPDLVVCRADLAGAVLAATAP